MLDFDLTLWIPGSTSLLFVLGLGAYVVVRGFRLRAARQQIQHRILVTGTRGKSSTVRLIHEALSSLGLRSYGKVTGTTAVELGVGGRQHDTSRWGTIGVSEMVDAMHRARLQKADYGVFECMAVSLPLIEIVQRDMVRADIVIIPTIRLDHLEEEGHSELEIAMNILKAVRQPKVVITAISQDDLIAAYQAHCRKNHIELIQVAADSNTPVVPGHHPSNVAITIALCNYLNLDTDTAITSLINSSREPEAGTIWHYRSGHLTLDYCDLGQANDPQSSQEALQRSGIRQKDRELVPILVNRWDRPLRALSFVHSLDQGRFPAVVVTGSLFPLSRKVLRTAGLESRSVIRLTRRLAADPHRLLRKLTKHIPHTDKATTLVSLQNVHDPKIDLLHRTMQRVAVPVAIGGKKNA